MKRRQFLRQMAVLTGGLMPTYSLAAVGGGLPRPERVIRLADNGSVLINPMMGWTLYYYSHMPNSYADAVLEPLDPLDDFPGISSIYMRLPWDLLEPEEGLFNWTVFDTPAQRWIDRGKQIAIRVTCSESWHRWATPKWVFDAGAKGYFYDDGGLIHPGGALWEPDFGDPVFLEKLDHFLAAMAARYDGNPNVAYIDIGSFGLWGEGHTLGTKITYPDEIKIRHLELHLKHFKKTLLVVSDDIIGPTAPGADFPVTDYALAHGITLRDDSILVSKKRPYFHTDLMGKFWPKLPVIIEHEHYAGWKSRGVWTGEHLYQAVLDYHASYVSIQAPPRPFYAENRPYIERINRKLGYRLVVTAVSLPDRITPGIPFECRVRIGNDGVAPCYPSGYICLTVKDVTGGIVGVFVFDGFSVRDLSPAGDGILQEREVVGHFVFKRTVDGLVAPTKVNGGEGTVYLSIGRIDGTPVFQLPLEGDDGQHRYRIASLTIHV